MKEKSRTVFSSEYGRMCPDCGHPKKSCRCSSSQANPPAGDGTVRIRRESKGRGGKTVTVITGFSLSSDALKILAGELKRRCGTGGTVKGWTIEIQGDHLDLLMSDLSARGYKVKRGGG